MPKASGESPRTVHPPFRCGRDRLFTALKGGKRACTPQATMVELIQLGGGGCKGGKLPPCKENELKSVNG